MNNNKKEYWHISFLDEQQRSPNRQHGSSINNQSHFQFQRSFQFQQNNPYLLNQSPTINSGAYSRPPRTSQLFIQQPQQYQFSESSIPRSFQAPDLFGTLNKLPTNTSRIAVPSLESHPQSSELDFFNQTPINPPKTETPPKLIRSNTRVMASESTIKKPNRQPLLDSKSLTSTKPPQTIRLERETKRREMVEKAVQLEQKFESN